MYANKTISFTSKLLLVLLLMLNASTSYSHGNDDSHTQPFVVTGVVPHSDGWEEIEAFVAWLSKKTGFHFHPLLVNNYSELTNILKKNPSALGWTCGLPFVQDEKEFSQKLIAVPLFNGEPVYHSLVVTRKDNIEKSLHDFKDKVLAYSDNRSNSGWLAPSVELYKAGVEDLSNYFSFIIKTGLHENSIVAIESGAADVAAVDEYVWVQYMKKHPDKSKELIVLNTLGPFPFTPIVSGSNVSDAVIESIQAVLTTMNDDQQGQAILDRFGLDGFVVKNSSFYDPIREMLKTINK